eukprot:557881_1
MNDIQINLTISSFRFNQKISTLIRKYHTTIIKKSLENDETKVWKYKRPSPKENGINIHHGPYFYKEIGIDIHHGPYLDSNTYKLDVMYHGLSDIFPGYEDDVATCGGHEIDVEKSYEHRSDCCWRFRSDTMWYITFGDDAKVIWQSTATQSTNCNAIYMYIWAHKYEQVIKERRERGLQLIHKGLKKTHRCLKPQRNGTIYRFAHECMGSIWDDLLQTELNQHHIVVTTKGNSKCWTSLISEANMIFGQGTRSYFQREYKEETVYFSGMHFVFNVKSGYLRFKALILKRNAEGTIFGLEGQTNNDHESHIWICILLSLCWIGPSFG